MIHVKKISKRLFMVTLLLWALLATFESITGINTKTMAAWAVPSAGPGFKTTVENESQRITPTLKSVYNAIETIVYQSDSTQTMVETQLIENSEDWTKYPSKEVVATGYTAGVESTGKNPGHPLYGITFSGVKVKRDLYSTIAADPDVFPLGTVLWIPDYGFGVVADTGSAIKGNIIDLYYETVDDVYNEWGKRTVEVYIIQEGNGKLTEAEFAALNEDESMQVFRQNFLKRSEE